MYLFYIPQCTIRNRNVHISVLNGALWDLSIRLIVTPHLPVAAVVWTGKESEHLSINSFYIAYMEEQRDTLQNGCFISSSPCIERAVHIQKCSIKGDIGAFVQNIIDIWL